MKPWFEEKNAPNKGTVLCKAAEVKEEGVIEFEFGESIKTMFRMFIYRNQNNYFAYINRCPHFSVPLNLDCGDLFTSDKAQFICSHHYATFNTTSGLCTDGPCKGRSLTSIPIQVKYGNIVVDECLK